MTSARVPRDRDAAQPRESRILTISVNGSTLEGAEGQTIAGVLLGSGRLGWRTTSFGGRPRGVFCGIGVCFDCIAEVNGERDVRLCQRRAEDGDVVHSQQDALPVAVAEEES